MATQRTFTLSDCTNALTAGYTRDYIGGKAKVGIITANGRDFHAMRETAYQAYLSGADNGDTVRAFDVIQAQQNDETEAEARADGAW